MMNNIFIDESLASPPEHSRFQWTAFASDIGIGVGSVPRTIQTSLGNKQPFLLSRVSEEGFLYTQQFGCLSLQVFND